MGLRIATNVQSLTAQRYVGKASDAQRSTLEHLASGSRINKAADDAAGLAISERMRAQTRSIAQNIRNANDGVSMIQTAEGGMNEIGNILIRFRELSTQSASDTVSNTERVFIDKEVQQLGKEVTRISQSTEFNGKKLLTGEGESMEIQVGQGNNADTDRFVFDSSKINSTLESLGLSGISTLTKEESQNNLAKVDEAIKALAGNRSELGALQNRLQSGIANLSIYNENLTASRSRMWDADMASETADLTKNNILAQASTAVLGQANQNNMLALKLLT